MRYLSICSIWLLCYFAPQFAGDWYDSHFALYQSAISLLLLVSVLQLSSEWWTKEFGALCVIQIIFNLGDMVWNFPPSHYNEILATLNTIEFALIFGAGGITQIYRMFANARPGAGRSDSDSRYVPAGPQAQRGGNGQ